MTELPGWLSRFRRELSLFPDDIAGALGGMLTRLSPAFDGAADTDSDSIGEFDGYDGIARRGAYERLLTSEWALQRAVPLEFMRRAASGEHLFLNPRQRAPAAPRGTIVIFDAGPEQLGAPRIAHLAILILLAERARHRSEGFGWQIVHKLGEPLLTVVDAESVRTLLMGRLALRASENALADWCERFPSSVPWFVGAPRLVRGAPAGASVVEVSERVEPAGSALDVTVKPSRRAPRSVTVDVPQGPAAARLIRDPFQPRRQRASYKMRRDGDELLLNPQGSFVFYVDSNGALVRVPVGNQTQNTRARRQAYEPRDGMVCTGVGRIARKHLYLSIGNGVLVLHASEPIRKGLPLHLSCPWNGGEGSGLWPILTFLGTAAIAFVDGAGDLWRADFDHGRTELIGRGVRAIAPLSDGGGVVVVRSMEPNEASHGAVIRVERNKVVTLSEPAGDWRSVHLRLEQANLQRAVVAAEVDVDAYRLFWQRTRVPDTARPPPGYIMLHALSGCSVVGVDCAGEGLGSLGLLMLGDDGTSLLRVGRGHSKQLLRANSYINRVTVASTRGIIAYTTIDGELGFVERSGKVLWQGPREKT